MEPESPGNNYEKYYLEAERIQQRDQEVEKQFDKRYKIRKHGCQYLSLITDLMTGNQNYGIRTIEQEFQMLLDLHTGTGLSVHPVRDVCPVRSFGSSRPRRPRLGLLPPGICTDLTRDKDIYNLQPPRIRKPARKCWIPHKNLSSIFAVDSPYSLAVCMPPKTGSTNWRKAMNVLEMHAKNIKRWNGDEFWKPSDFVWEVEERLYKIYLSTRSLIRQSH